MGSASAGLQSWLEAPGYRQVLTIAPTITFPMGSTLPVQACNFGEAPGYWRVGPHGRRQWALYDDTCALADLLSSHLQVPSIVVLQLRWYVYLSDYLLTGLETLGFRMLHDECWCEGP